MGGHPHLCHVELAERSAEGRLLPTGRKTSLHCQEYVKKMIGLFFGLWHNGITA